MESNLQKIMKALSTFECWYLTIGCISLLPLYVYSNYHLEGTQLEKSLSNDNVRLVFAASASFAIPLLLDVIMDLSSPVASPSSFARLVLITSTCVPALIFISPSQQPQYGIANVYVIVAGAQRIIG